jgi:hypothetical protein
VRARLLQPFRGENADRISRVVHVVCGRFASLPPRPVTWQERDRGGTLCDTMSNFLMNAFIVLFAVACLATFAFGARKQWKDARIISAVVAVLSFLSALITAQVSAK